MVRAAEAIGAKVLLDRDGLQSLLDELHGRGFDVVGPTVRDGAIVHDRIGRIDEMPAGWGDRQEAGHYRLERRADAALFGFNSGPHAWKQFLHPPEERLFRATRQDGGFALQPEPPPAAPFAATSSQRGCSGLSCNRCFRPSVSIRRPIAASVRARTDAADCASWGPAGRERSAASTSAPVSLPTSVRKSCRASSISSVRARSKPAVACGPVCIEAQKQVAAAVPQFSATIKAPCRRPA